MRHLAGVQLVSKQLRCQLRGLIIVEGVSLLDLVVLSIRVRKRGVSRLVVSSIRVRKRRLSEITSLLREAVGFLGVWCFCWGTVGLVYCVILLGSWVFGGFAGVPWGWCTA
jgi:hypothetical protein